MGASTAMPLPMPLVNQAVQSLVPPVAARRPKAMSKFGDRRVDEYFWLRDKESPEVIEYLEAENAYARAAMKPLEKFREALYQEMLGRIQQTDESVPYRCRGYWYYHREVEGRQYPLYCRRKGTMRAPEEVLLDVNALARGRKFTQLGAMEVSPDGKRIAYTVDFVGFRQYRLYVKELGTGRLTRDKAERVTSVAWAADSRTLFYAEEHATTKRSFRLHRLALGSRPETVFEEPDERFDIGVYT